MDQLPLQFCSDDVNPAVDQILLDGRAKTMGAAEEMYLDDHLSEILALVKTLSDEEFIQHEAVKLLFLHGSRPWEDEI